MNQYKTIIDSLDLKKGDIVLVASDLINLAMQARRKKEKFKPDVLINGLIDVIGEQGTLLLPTYNWDFCKGATFDYNNTRSKTGSLSNEALKRDDFLRTKHPIYSFAVWGKNQEKLKELENKSAFGNDSPFSYLHEQHARMIMIDVDYQNSFTFVHYVEEMASVDYRYDKEFTADYIDESGQMRKATYSMFVRDLEMGVETRVNPIGIELEKQGAAIVKEVDSILYRIVDLEKAYTIINDDITNNAARKLHIIRGD